MKTKHGLFLIVLVVLLVLPSTQVAVVDTSTIDVSQIEPTNPSLLAEVDPSFNIDFQAAYHSGADKVILYGGWNETPDYATGETWSYDLDTNSFVNLHPVVTPSPRFLCSMAYDSQSDKIVMFGGYRGQAYGTTYDETWIYDYSTNNWTQGSPGASPSWRYGFQLVYDSESDIIMFFGGMNQGGSSYMDDTWAYNVDTDTWTQMSPAVSPEARMDYTMEYDPHNDRVILFGGIRQGIVYSDQWSYDYNTDTWTELTPSYRPSQRANPSMAYDNESQLMVLFAGNTGDAPLDDVWHYNYGSNSWTHYANPSNAPIVRHRHELVYDIQSDRIISIGGGLGPYLGADWGLVNDTLWSYDTNTNHWRQMSPSFPQGRGDPLMTYDSGADRVIIHGGWISVTEGDTWTYDMNSDLFYNMAPNPTAPTRQISAMEYDSQSGKSVMFSGLLMWPEADFPNDTWTYEYSTNNWTQVYPALAPLGRGGHRMAYDSESDRIILFGGRLPDTNGLSDTWAYDLETNTWEQMSPTLNPGPRWYHALTYDEESDRIILFGGWGFGGVGSTAGDTWAYDYNTDTWAELTPAGSPPGRRFHSISYDNESDRVVLFGGNNGNDLDDTWFYDYNTNTWTQSAAHPHPNARQRHEIVYDGESDRVVLYGGISEPYPAQTTEEDFPIDPCWTYDVNSDTWTAMDLNPGYVDEETDTDLDGLPDVIEYVIGTFAENPDSDSDLMPDGWEYDNGLDPLFDDSQEDPDGDLLVNLDEYLNEANPHSTDSDSDAIPDYDEVMTYGTHPGKADTDDDLIPDLYEINNGLDPLSDDAGFDLDSDDLTNLLEYQVGTGVNDPDSDSDGASDGWEYHNGLDPLDPTDGAEDPDEDGLVNHIESDYGSNPFEVDSDFDGYSDTWEVQNGFDPMDPFVSAAQIALANLNLIVLGVLGVATFVIGYRVIALREVRKLKQKLQDFEDEEQQAVRELAEDANNHNHHEEESVSDE